MSPIAIDYLIALKTIESGKTKMEITNEVIAVLKTTPKTYKKLTGPEGNECRFSTRKLIVLCDYFDANPTDILNPIYVNSSGN